VNEAVNFGYQDKDGDGALNREEIVEWISPNIDQVSNFEAVHLFGITDKDKDGQLTKEEVLGEHELWVGSEATDYGEMLMDRDEL
jgi:Ca2+-binding EF-hand superfamily protein